MPPGIMRTKTILAALVGLDSRRGSTKVGQAKDGRVIREK